MYFDTSYVMDKMPKEQFVRMVRAHGVDKILFATDSPWTGQKQQVELFLDLPFNENERDIILHKNAEKLL